MVNPEHLQETGIGLLHQQWSLKTYPNSGSRYRPWEETGDCGLLRRMPATPDHVTNTPRPVGSHLGTCKSGCREVCEECEECPSMEELVYNLLPFCALW